MYSTDDDSEDAYFSCDDDVSSDTAEDGDGMQLVAASSGSHWDVVSSSYEIVSVEQFTAQHQMVLAAVSPPETIDLDEAQNTTCPQLVQQNELLHSGQGFRKRSVSATAVVAAPDPKRKKKDSTPSAVDMNKLLNAYDHVTKCCLSRDVLKVTQLTDNWRKHANSKQIARKQFLCDALQAQPYAETATATELKFAWLGHPLCWKCWLKVHNIHQQRYYEMYAFLKRGGTQIVNKRVGNSNAEKVHANSKPVLYIVQVSMFTFLQRGTAVGFLVTWISANTCQMPGANQVRVLASGMARSDVFDEYRKSMAETGWCFGVASSLTFR